MKIKIYPLLRYFICFGIFMTAYPVIALANGYLKKDNTLLECGILVLLAMGIFLFRDILITRKVNSLVAFFLPILPILATIAFVVISQATLAARLVGGIVALLIGILAFCLAGSEALAMLPNTTLIFITAIDIIITFWIWKAGFSFQPFVTVFVYFFTCAIYYILLNQENLKNLTESRHYSFSALPPKIRSYNLTLIGKLLAIIAVAFLVLRNFKTIITWLGEQLYALWKYLINLIMILFPSSDSSGEIMFSQDNPQMPLMPGEEPSNSILGDIIFFILQALVLCGIVAFIGYLLYRLIKWRPTQKVREITPEYTDSEQPLMVSLKRNRSAFDNRRRWRRDYSAYKKMTSDFEKFQTGYRLAIRGLSLSGLPLKNSDTTCEIDDKANKTLREQTYHAATSSYNFMAYGENDYSPEALSSLDKALAEIAELRK